MNPSTSSSWLSRSTSARSSSSVTSFSKRIKVDLKPHFFYFCRNFFFNLIGNSLSVYQLHNVYNIYNNKTTGLEYALLQ